MNQGLLSVPEGSSRAPWTRWSDADAQRLRELGGHHTAEQIGSLLGRTVEQVRGKARALRVDLRLKAAAQRHVNVKISGAVSRAWRDPTKRERMLDGIWTRPLAGAASGAPRRTARFAFVNEGLHRHPLYAAAHAVAPHGLCSAEREDLVGELVLAVLEGAVDVDDLKGLAAPTLKRLRQGPSSHCFVALDAPLSSNGRMTIGDLIPSDAEHF